MVVTVPPIREHFGYKPAEMVPTTYPRMLTRDLHSSLLTFLYQFPIEHEGQSKVTRTNKKAMYTIDCRVGQPGRNYHHHLNSAKVRMRCILESTAVTLCLLLFLLLSQERSWLILLPALCCRRIPRALVIIHISGNYLHEEALESCECSC